MLLLLACAHNPGGGLASPATFDSEAAFTRAAAARMGVVLAPAKATVQGPLVVVVTDPTGRTIQLTLDRLQRLCAAAPEGCEGEVDHFAKVSFSMLGEPPPLTLDQLRMSIRPQGYIEAVLGTGQRPVAVSLVGDLYVLMMADALDTSRAVMIDDLPALGVPTAEITDRAMANTAADVGDLRALAGPLPPQAFAAIAEGEYYEASLLLQTEAWAQLAPQVAGTLMVSVPGHDMIFYGWVSDADKLAAMKQITAAAYGAAERPMSKMVFAWSDKGWVVAP
jgi:hypothetical protein